MHVPSSLESLAEFCTDGECPCRHWWREDCSWCHGKVENPLMRLLLKGNPAKRNIGCVSCRRIWMQKKTVIYERIDLPVSLDGQG